MPKPVSLTKRELDIMSVLWRRRSATVGEIRDDLTDDLAYPTVQTMLRVLEGKGYVKHTQDGRAFRFHPLVAQDDLADSVLKRLITKVYHGSRELLVTRLIADDDISADELKRIKKALQRRIDEAEQ
jgi:BlaI family transcriptional regulator, penicillinase repressor